MFWAIQLNRKIIIAMVAFICVIIWIIIMLVLMFPFGLLENPQKRLSKGNSAIVIIVGAGSAILLDYMYNEHYELLYKFFLAIGVIGVVIYALGISFFRSKDNCLAIRTGILFLISIPFS